MQSTALPRAPDDLSDDDRTALLANRGLRRLVDVFATTPDACAQHGRRYDLPFPLTCPVGVFLCNCNSRRRWVSGAGIIPPCYGVSSPYSSI